MLYNYVMLNSNEHEISDLDTLQNTKNEAAFLLRP